MTDDRRAVIAIGGNALILEGQRGTIAEQMENARDTARHFAALVKDGWKIVVTHGNGPQVGFILLRSELVGETPLVPSIRLDMASADSQGGIGHILTTALLSELAAVGIRDRVAYVLTHTVVDERDPAFREPTKPIGPAFTVDEAATKRAKQGWMMVEDSGRGYRRVVPSPQPLRIVESAAIRSLVDQGYIVVAVGGGGIPVVEEAPGVYRAVEAVIDKDFASALLASSLGIPLLCVTTGVERVAVRFRKPDQRFLDRITLTQARGYLADGEFPKGSMGPKISAAIAFLERGGREVLISTPMLIEEAVKGKTGTRIVPD
jgi:carbamate kinase